MRQVQIMVIFLIALANYSNVFATELDDFVFYRPLNAQFDAVDDGIDYELHGVIEPNSESYSISFWFFSTSSQHGALVSKGNYFSDHHGWRFYLENGKLIFRVTSNDRISAAQSRKVEFNQWHHVVGVIDRSKGEVKLYVDGRSKSSENGGGGARSNRLSSEPIQSPQPLRIGYSSDPDSGHVKQGWFQGRIANLHISKARLTPEQIWELHDIGYREVVLNSKARFREVVVFRRNDDHCYRIPAILRLRSGTLMAIAERRHGYQGKLCSDHGKIDIVAKYSVDNGKRWSKEQVVVSYGGREFARQAFNGWVAANNPVPVIDASGRIHIIFNVSTSRSGSDNSQKAVTNGEALRTSWIVSSVDEGRSWSRPNDITRMVKKPDWRFYSHGPGHGLRTRKGRLIVPTYHNSGPRTPSQVSLAYSDNNGRSWKLGRPTPNGGVSESQAVELKDGSILVNSRRVGKRQPHSRRVSISTDRANLSHWRSDEALPSSKSHGSITRFSWSPRQQGAGFEYASGTNSQIVFVNPASTKHRRNLTVRLSEDEGQTWRYSRRIRARDAAYSDTVVTQDDRIGVLYEGTQSNLDANQAILFATFTPEWVKGAAN